MSVALFVKLRRPIPLGDIESFSSAALQQLLVLSIAPPVTAKFDLSSPAGDSSNDLLGVGAKRVLCSIVGHEEEVAIMPLSIPMQVPMEDDSIRFADQAYISVRWEYKRTPLCYALNAAVAAGIARCQDSMVEENSGFFTLTGDQPPDDFIRSLGLSALQKDIEQAAVYLYAKMPKSTQLMAAGDAGPGIAQ